MDVIVVGGMDVRQVEIPAIQASVHRHQEHSGEDVVAAFCATISLGVEGASREFMGA